MIYLLLAWNVILASLVIKLRGDHETLATKHRALEILFIAVEVELKKLPQLEFTVKALRGSIDLVLTKVKEFNQRW